MTIIRYDEVFAYYNENSELICPECASTLLDLDKISSGQILTRDEAERDEGFYFCDVHPEGKNNQIV